MHPIDAIIVKTCFLQAAPQRDTLLRSLGLDSFRLAQLLVDIEHACNVTFSARQMDNMINVKTVGHLYEMLEAAQATQG